MNPDTLWLVRLGIDQGLFTRVQAVNMRGRLAGKTGIVDFAQKLIDEDVVTDVEALEKLAGQAALNGKKGPPKTDPFVAADDLVEDVVVKPVKKVELGPPPDFAFEDIETMDDKHLGDSLEVLLGDCVRHGASDLHLCTGRRPFLRKNREIAYISRSR
jgi:twitching motility protein PilT